MTVPVRVLVTVTAADLLSDRPLDRAIHRATGRPTAVFGHAVHFHDDYAEWAVDLPAAARLWLRGPHPVTPFPFTLEV